MQFRNDDYTQWAIKYGSGQQGNWSTGGDTTYSYNKTSFSGSSGQAFGTAGNGALFSPGDVVFLHQSYNASSQYGAWQLNFVVNVVGNTVYFLYNLQQTYTTGAQICTLLQWNIFYHSSGTIYAPGYDGTVGGILPIMAKEMIKIDGNLSATGAGYRGGWRGINQNPGYRGESYNHRWDTEASTSQNTGGGGGGKANAGSNAGGGGGGGGHQSSGESGGGHNGSGGQGGTTIGSTELTTMFFGPGGGGNGMDTGLVQINGSPGGGIIFLIAPTIIINGVAYGRGNNASNSGYANGGAGAGGSFLAKCDTFFASNIDFRGGDRGGDFDWNAFGGYGGYGRINIDYNTSQSVSNSNGVPVHTYQRTVLKKPSNSFGMML